MDPFSFKNTPQRKWIHTVVNMHRLGKWIHSGCCNGPLYYPGRAGLTVFAMSEHADACIAYFDEHKLDITLLWLLQHWDWLDTFVFGKKLVSFIERTMKLRRGHVERKGFQDRVTTVFLGRGVQRICPDRKVQAYRMEETFRLCIDRQWPEPFLPFMLQMRPGVFVMFANWQDGFHWILKKTWKKVHTFEGKNLPLDLLYEKQVVGLGKHGDMPCQLIIDFDAYVDEFGGRLSMDELKQLMSKVLPWFSEKIVSIGALRMDQTLVVVEKEKSRTKTSKGPKVSRHYIFNLIGLSTREQRAILRRIFVDTFSAERKKQKDTKSMAHVKIGSDACMALLGDVSTMHGRNQFSTLFCGKEGETPPKITNIYEIGQGGRQVKVTPWRWAEDEHTPDHEHALEMLFHACYSCMNIKTVTLNSNFHVLITEPMGQVGNAFH